MTQISPTFISIEKTIGDVAERFSDDDIYFYSGNFHIYDYDVYYGNGVLQNAVGEVNSVISFDKGNLRDIFFRNKTAGSNATVVFVGTIRTPQEQEDLWDTLRKLLSGKSKL